MAKNKKKQKEKVVYYDDNSTISDMSGVSGVHNRLIPTNMADKFSQKQQPKNRQKQPSTYRDKANTYFTTVKLMLVPMCIVLAILGILFLLLRLIAQ